MSEAMKISRRSFVQTAAVASGGLVLGLHIPPKGMWALAAMGGTKLNAWVHIGTDDTVTIRASQTELGHDDTELSWVGTSGNADTSSLGLANKLWHRWKRSGFETNLTVVRVQETASIFFAVGTPSDFKITEERTTRTTAENYFINALYGREITERFFWSVGAEWYRNRPAGIQDRYRGWGGVGNIWYDREKLKLRTDYALSYTSQNDIITDPTADDSFPGLRLAVAYKQWFGDNTDIGNDTTFNQNLKEGSDYQVNSLTSVGVSMTDSLALRFSIQLLYENQPALKAVTLFDIDPSDPAAVNIGTVTREADKLDTVARASLVVSF